MPTCISYISFRILQQIGRKLNVRVGTDSCSHVFTCFQVSYNVRLPTRVLWRRIAPRKPPARSRILFFFLAVHCVPYACGLDRAPMVAFGNLSRCLARFFKQPLVFSNGLSALLHDFSPCMFG